MLLLALTSCKTRNGDLCIDNINEFEIINFNNDEYSATIIISKHLIHDSIKYKIIYDDVSNISSCIYVSPDTSSYYDIKIPPKKLSYYNAYIGTRFLNIIAPCDRTWVINSVEKFTKTDKNDSLIFKDRIEFYNYFLRQGQNFVGKVTYFYSDNISIGMQFPVSDTTWTARNKTECEPFVQLVDMKFKEKDE